MKRYGHNIVLVAVALLGWPAGALATPLTLTQTFTGALTPGVQFGRSVAISGNTVVVGSPLDDKGTIVTQDTNFGRAFLYSGVLYSGVRDDVVIDFGPGVGTWKWINDGAWVLLHGLSPEVMVSGNLDGM